jgi:poly(beta-D-mannuronate) lyase
MNRVIEKGLALTVVACLAACTTDTVDVPSPTSLVPTADATVEVPVTGEVMLKVAARKAELAKLPLEERRRLCGTPQTVWPSHPVVRTIKLRADGGPDSRSEPFALAVMQEAALVLAEGDTTAHAALLNNLDRWARGAALTKIEEASNSYYALDRTLLPTIIAWSILRETSDVEPERRQRVERWLHRLMRLRGDQRSQAAAGETTLRNNHYFLRASVSMAWGALVENHDYFEEGMAAFSQALADMRTDGSLPLETERGARALWYQRHAIASLVAIAEMAALHGRDLYAEERDGRSLHRAIRFLLDAIDDPRLVATYAQVDYKPGIDLDPTQQDLSFLTRRGHDRRYMAWAELYLARFPERLESQRLLTLLRGADPDFRPMIDDYSGGNMSCFFTPVEGKLVDAAPNDPAR